MKPTTPKIHRYYTYTAKNGCRVSKHFASEETATAWLERVGASDIVYRGELLWNTERRWWEPRDAS